MPVIISPSIFAANPGNFDKAFEEISGADMVHVDIMDGTYVPNISFGPWMIDLAHKHHAPCVDVHLMVDDILEVAPWCVKAGADIITVHTGPFLTPEMLIPSFKEAGICAGIALNPSTPVSFLDSVIDQYDIVLVMTVWPGFSGQTFMPEVLPKIEELRKLREKRGLSFQIEVDGGIGRDNAQAVVDAGADILVMGSSLFGAKDVAKELAYYHDTLRERPRA